LQREFFACRQLPFACVTGETSEMIDVLASATHPIAGLNVSAAFRAFVSEVSEKTRGNEAIVLCTCAFTCNSLAGKESADLSRSTLIAYPALFDTRRIAGRTHGRLSSRRVDKTGR
jgi:DNA-binding transcriptional regulator YbjK